jgi:hypothetical protein
VAAAALILGSFLPWVRVDAFGFSASRSGIDEGGDGWFTLVAGVVAVVAFVVVANDTTRAHRAPLIAALVVSAVALLVGIVDWADVHDRVAETDGLATVGVGLYLVVVAAAAAVAASIVCLVRGPGRPAVPSA